MFSFSAYWNKCMHMVIGKLTRQLVDICNRSYSCIITYNHVIFRFSTSLGNSSYNMYIYIYIK